MPRRPIALAALVGAALLLLPAGCASSSSEPAGSSSSGGAVQVVASTNVWGDVVHQVGGDLVDVASIISDPNADPHSYQASSQVQLKLSRAALVVENGGGYDDFVGTMLSAVSHRPTVINAVEVSGKTAAAGAELNEHVWYDFPTVVKVADAIATDLGTLDPAHAATYTANAATFTAQVDGLITRAGRLKATTTDKGVAITEPVPVYLLGAVDKTPADFSEAIENGTDVPPAVLKQTLDLFTSHQVVALVYNEQTTGPQTEQVLAAAKSANVAVVPVTETLPDGKDYLTWMTANLDAVSAALTG